MEIRPAVIKDRNQIEDIFDLYWSDDFRVNLSKKLDGYFESSIDVTRQNFTLLVLEEKGEILGVSAYRKVPDHMFEFTSTEKPGELYVIAVKNRNRGIGTVLRDKSIEDLTKQGYTEIVFFSGETHQDSWEFHDNSNFVRRGEMTAPNGEKGYVWRLHLI